MNSELLRYPSVQRFLKCAPRIPKDPRPFPRDPWIHFYKGLFEVYLFLIKRIIIKNNRGTSLIGDVFVSL